MLFSTTFELNTQLNLILNNWQDYYQSNYHNLPIDVYYNNFHLLDSESHVLAAKIACNYQDNGFLQYIKQAAINQSQVSSELTLLINNFENPTIRTNNPYAPVITQESYIEFYQDEILHTSKELIEIEKSQRAIIQRKNTEKVKYLENYKRVLNILHNNFIKLINDESSIRKNILSGEIESFNAVLLKEIKFRTEILNKIKKVKVTAASKSKKAKAKDQEKEKSKKAILKKKFEEKLDTIIENEELHRNNIIKEAQENENNLLKNFIEGIFLDAYNSMQLYFGSPDKSALKKEINTYIYQLNLFIVKFLGRFNRNDNSESSRLGLLHGLLFNLKHFGSVISELATINDITELKKIDFKALEFYARFLINNLHKSLKLDKKTIDTLQYHFSCYAWIEMSEYLNEIITEKRITSLKPTVIKIEDFIKKRQKNLALELNKNFQEIVFNSIEIISSLIQGFPEIPNICCENLWIKHLNLGLDLGIKHNNIIQEYIFKLLSSVLDKNNYIAFKAITKVAVANKLNLNDLLDKNIKYTLLHSACSLGRHEIVEALLETNKVDINILTIEKLSAFHLACITGRIEIIRLFINKDVRINKVVKNGSPIIFRPIFDNKIEVLNELLKFPGIDILQKNHNGQNIFHVACRLGNLEIINTLIKLNPEFVHMEDDYGLTPAWISCDTENHELVKVLLQNNADFKKINVNGESPASRVMKKGNMPILMTIKNGKMEIESEDSNGVRILKM